MLDVEKLTYDNQERRRMAEKFRAWEAAAKKREQNEKRAEKRRIEQARTSRVCYLVGATCIGYGCAYLTTGLAFFTESILGQIGIYVTTGLIFLAFAVLMDEGA